jgi:hypothetical protein
MRVLPFKLAASPPQAGVSQGRGGEQSTPAPQRSRWAGRYAGRPKRDQKNEGPVDAMQRSFVSAGDRRSCHAGSLRCTALNGVTNCIHAACHRNHRPDSSCCRVHPATELKSGVASIHRRRARCTSLSADGDTALAMLRRALQVKSRAASGVGLLSRSPAHS